MIKASWHSGPEAFQNLRGPWKDLVTRSSNATPFQTWEWQDLYSRHYGTARNTRILTLTEGDDLIALWPMVDERALWRTLRPAGIGPSDYLHPLVADGASEFTQSHLRNAISENKNVDILDLHQIRETQGVATWPQQGARTQATCFVLDLPASYDAYLGTLTEKEMKKRHEFDRLLRRCRRTSERL